MNLFIMRHADAQLHAASDELRRLSALGVSETERILKANVAHLSDVEHICVSPYRRAQETSALVSSYLRDSAACNQSIELETCDFLTPNNNPASVIEWLYELQEKKRVQSLLLISHQPLVSSLIELLCNSGQASPGNYPMPTSSLACVSLSVLAAGCGDLLFLRSPENACFSRTVKNKNVITF